MSISVKTSKPLLQSVYRNSAGRVAVEVVHADQSRSGSNELLPNVPVKISPGLRLELAEQQLITSALLEVAS